MLLLISLLLKYPYHSVKQLIYDALVLGGKLPSYFLNRMLLIILICSKLDVLGCLLLSHFLIAQGMKERGDSDLYR